MSLDSLPSSELLELLGYATPSELDEIERLLKADEQIDAESMPEHFHAGQAAVWADEAALDIVACAGAQGGKTEEDAYWLLREIQRTAKYCEHLKGKRAVYLFVGPTLELLTSQAIPSFEALFVEEHQLGTLIKGGKQRFVFSPEGAKRLCGKPYKIEVRFAYANDSSNLESVTALGGVWDEAGQKENKVASLRAYNRRLKVARSLGKKLGVVLGRRLFTTTPYEWGWFKRDIVDPALAKEPGYAFYNWPSWFNPIVDEAECRRDLDRMPLEEWRMMYLGIFERPGGLIYDCFDDVIRPGSNVWPTIKLPDEWPRAIGIDFGPNNTAAVIFAQALKKLGYDAEDKPIWGEPTGLYICEREYHTGRSDTPEGHMHRIIGLLVSPFCAGGARNEEDSRLLYGMHGLPIARPLIADVEAGIRNVYGLLKSRQLVVLACCTGVIAQFGTYSRELDDDGAKDEKIKDKAKFHFMDGVRYIASYFSPYEPEKPKSHRPEPVESAYSFEERVTR